MVKKFDVFLAHNSEDKEYALQIAKELRQRKLNPWLDSEQIRPGEDFIIAIQRVRKECRAFAVLVGKEGIGRWQEEEIGSQFQEYVEGPEKIPIIPVLLPGVTKLPKEVQFLNKLHRIEFRHQISKEAIDELVFGITGVKPPLTPIRYAIAAKGIEAANVCFVSLPTAGSQELYSAVKDVIAKLGLRCVSREDEDMDAADSIFAVIKQARIIVSLCLGDAQTTLDPRVLYETGMATALGKPLLVFTEDRQLVEFFEFPKSQYPYVQEVPCTGFVEENMRQRISDAAKHVLANCKVPYLVSIDRDDVDAIYDCRLLLSRPVFWTHFCELLDFGLEVHEGCTEVYRLVSYLQRLSELADPSAATSYTMNEFKYKVDWANLLQALREFKDEYFPRHAEFFKSLQEKDDRMQENFRVLLSEFEEEIAKHIRHARVSYDCLKYYLADEKSSRLQSAKMLADDVLNESEGFSTDLAEDRGDVSKLRKPDVMEVKPLIRRIQDLAEAIDRGKQEAARMTSQIVKSLNEEKMNDECAA